MGALFFAFFIHAKAGEGEFLFSFFSEFQLQDDAGSFFFNRLLLARSVRFSRIPVFKDKTREEQREDENQDDGRDADQNHQG